MVGRMKCMCVCVCDVQVLISHEHVQRSVVASGFCFESRKNVVDRFSSDSLVL